MKRIIFYRVEQSISVERLLRKNGFSRHLLTQLKTSADGLTVNGDTVYTNHMLSAGDFLRVCLSENAVTETVAPVPLPLTIVYEDEDLLVVDKPAGMAVHPSQGNRDSTVANALAALYVQRREPFVFRPIGRLDKNTSGLLLLAKNAIAACLLTQNGYSRIYFAVCEGVLEPSGIIAAPICRIEGSSIARKTSHDGDMAITRYTRLITDGRRSVARVWLETGRTHQIRVHFASIGHPLTGDFLYGTEVPTLDRHALHAGELSFSQPLTGKALSFHSPLPDQLNNLLNKEGQA